MTLRAVVANERQEVFVDADFGGDRESRKSISSCVMMMLGNPILAYARQQALLATSSCEADCYALASGLTGALGFPSPFSELQKDYSITVR